MQHNGLRLDRDIVLIDAVVPAHVLPREQNPLLVELNGLVDNLRIIPQVIFGAIGRLCSAHDDGERRNQH